MTGTCAFGDGEGKTQEDIEASHDPVQPYWPPADREGRRLFPQLRRDA